MPVLLPLIPAALGAIGVIGSAAVVTWLTAGSTFAVALYMRDHHVCRAKEVVEPTKFVGSRFVNDPRTSGAT